MRLCPKKPQIVGGFGQNDEEIWIPFTDTQESPGDLAQLQYPRSERNRILE